MENFLKKLQTLTGKNNLFNSRGTILATLIAGAAGAFLLAIIDINRSQMIPLGVVLLITVFLGYFEYLNVARWVSLFSALIVISSLVFQNKGIRDPAVLGLVVVLISAGLLAGRKGTILF